jgi:hypothetical protein
LIRIADDTLLDSNVNTGHAPYVEVM